MKLAVIGCGAIGGVVGAFLHKAGADVLLVDTNQVHVDAIRQRGLLIDGDGVEPMTVYPYIVANANEVSEPLDVVFLAVKSVATRAATQSVLPHLKSNSTVVVLQNGLGNEEIVANIVGPERVLAGVVGWGATFTGPGHITRTSSEGGFEIGEWIGGGVSQRTCDVAAVLSEVAPTVSMSNILGVKWTKLIINATINSLGAALGRRLGEMVADPRSRFLMLRLITEGVTVAHAEGVQLEKVNEKLNMGLLVLESYEQERARHQAGGARRLWLEARYHAGFAIKSVILKQMAKVHGHIKSSMWQDIEAGRRTEIDVLNEYIAVRARERGVPVPVTEALVGLIKEIEQGASQIDPVNMGLLEEAGMLGGAIRPPKNLVSEKSSCGTRVMTNVTATRDKSQGEEQECANATVVAPHAGGPASGWSRRTWSHPLGVRAAAERMTAPAVGASVLALGRTMIKLARVSSVGREEVLRLKASGRRIVFVSWHGHNLCNLGVYPKLFGSESRVVIMVPNATWAGRVMEHIAAGLAYEVVPIGTQSAAPESARGVAKIVSVIKDGCDAMIAVDGPLGPSEEVKIGAAVIAKRASAVIVPTVVVGSTEFRIRSRWDKHLLIPPFARMIVHFGPLIDTRPALDVALSEEDIRDRIDAALRSGVARARAIADAAADDKP